MEEKEVRSYDLYLMDMWADGYGGWEENQRFHLGVLTVGHKAFNTDEEDILEEMLSFRYREITGRYSPVITTTDRRRLFIEDVYGDGRWWEIGEVAGHRPIYGLRLREG